MSQPEVIARADVVAGIRRLPLVNALLLAVTALTTAMASALFLGFDPISDPRQLVHGIPFAATLITILLVHESGHYLMCRRHGVAASLPYFVPAPPNIVPVGTFGAFIRIRSRFPDRRALFDIGAAGPWAGFVVAVAATAIGLRLSTVLAAPPTEHTIGLGDSLLTTLLTRLVLGTNPDLVMLHPVAFAGWFGLFVTSLNLLPAGQLDGGHVLYAVVGRRTRLLPPVLLATLLWLGNRGWPGWFVWAGIIAVMVSLGHPPSQDDARPLGFARVVSAGATLAVLVLTFVPEPFRIVP
ncbi:MAG: site-2 protease family protein [Deltaproteobacteria bacterium]|nr:MAG: site-2 protease family protein [Deltaproteobacteria bacterium]